MELSRRDTLRMGAAGAALAALAGCGPAWRKVAGDPVPADLAPPPVNPEPEVRLANRLGFGIEPGQLDAMRAMGSEAWIEQQIEGDQEESLELTLQLHRLDVLRIDGMELRDTPENEIVRQLQQAAILRAAHSRNQLRERMADFWTNHFNIYARKGFASYRKGRDEREVVREHAMGSFPEMLRASTRSPAMIAYLDNTANFKNAPNENYARELLELHSLGVDGGYTHRDIVEVARCFTGWTIERGFLRPYGQLKFQPDWHDDGEKVVLGHRIPAGGGPKDAERVVDILIDHPSTPKFLAQKLSLYFLGQRSPELEAEVVSAYQRTNGDIKAMLRPLLMSKELLESPPILRRPFDFVISALRALQADTRAHQTLQDAMRAMGQPLYEWPMPDGYPVDFDAWSGSLLARWNFALNFAKGRFGDVRPRLHELRERFEGDDVAFCCAAFFGLDPRHPGVSREVRTLERHFAEAKTPNTLDEAAALCLCAPAFHWR